MKKETRILYRDIFKKWYFWVLFIMAFISDSLLGNQIGSPTIGLIGTFFWSWFYIAIAIFTIRLIKKGYNHFK